MFHLSWFSPVAKLVSYDTTDAMFGRCRLQCPIGQVDIEKLISLFCVVFICYSLLHIDYDDETKSVYTQDFCAEIASRITNPHFLPRECQRYENVVKQVEIRRRDTTDGTSILS